MKVSIKVEHAVKKYGDLTVIPDLSLSIQAGEFFTLLGPSGCGKTTLLRMIAGFNSIEGGRFYFNDKVINDLEPAKRNIGMVFQNYAIFPHMSVWKNVAFGLKNKKLPNQEIEEKTKKYLELMQIEPYKDRMPSNLSGGQQQRVALARALAIEPDVLLMDEPLSNLDAKLRVEMRKAIKDIQQRVGITTVYVTHDQEEAMAVSDRIAVFNEGKVQQIGTPRMLYQRPANLFVATFIGKSNILAGRLEERGHKRYIIFKDGYHVPMDNLTECPDTEALVAVRPEEFTVEPYQAGTGMRAVVEEVMFLGLNTHYFVKLDSGEQADVIQESRVNDDIEKGSVVSLTVKAEKINAFNQEGTVSFIRSEV